MKFQLLFLVSLGFSLNAQLPKPGLPEICWAAAHPIAAYKVKTLNKKCAIIMNTAGIQTRLDSINNGGKLDAFRHSFFMAAFTQKIKPRKVRKLGKAHEKNNYRSFKKSDKEYGEIPDSLSSVMDLKNNEIGITLGAANPGLNLTELAELVLKEISAGMCVILKRNKKKELLDCNGNIVDLAQYKKRWSVPKCLVPSNHQPAD